jgi:hypothetical protein
MAFRVAEATNKCHALIHVFDLLELRMIVGCGERPEVFDHVLVQRLLAMAKARTALVRVRLPNDPAERSTTAAGKNGGRRR